MAPVKTNCCVGTDLKMFLLSPQGNWQYSVMECIQSENLLFLNCIPENKTGISFLMKYEYIQ